MKKKNSTMYFQIENTPENKTRKKDVVKATEEETPCLVLAPFMAAPKVIFENIPVGTVAERNLDIVNPTTKTLQILLGKAPPPGMTLLLPADHITLAPQEAYCVTLRWVPAKPVAQRETIHFTDEQRGRYDVVVILKAVIVVKKNVKTKAVRKSPTKLVVKKIGVRTSPKRIKEMSPKVRPSTPKIVKTMERKSIKAGISSLQKQELHNYVDIRVPKNKPMRSTVSTQICQGNNSAHFIDIRPPQNKLNDESYSIQDKTETYNFNFNQTVDIEPEYIRKDYYKDDKKAVLSNRNMLSPPNVLSAIDNYNFTPLKSFKTTPCKSNRSEKENIYCGHQNDQPYSILTENHQNDVRKPVRKSLNVDDIFDDVNFTPGEKFADRFAKGQETEDIRRDTYAIKRTNKPIPLFYENSPDSLEGGKTTGAVNPIINISDDYRGNDSVQFGQCIQKELDSNNSVIAIDVTIGKEKSVLELKSPNLTLDKTPPRGYHIPSVGVTVNNVSCQHLNDTHLTFNPHRCSTEMKNSSKENCTHIPNHICKGLLFNNDLAEMKTPDSAGNKSLLQLSSETFIRDSPIIPLDPNNPDNQQSSPYAMEHEKSPTYKYHPESGQPRLLSFTESNNPLNQPRKIIKNRNCADGIRNIIEADMWQDQIFTPHSTSLVSLACIPEESSQISEYNKHNTTNKRLTTFAVNRTFDKVLTNKEINCKKNWSKGSVKVNPDLWKIPESYVKTEAPQNNIGEKDITRNISSHSLNLGSYTDYLIGNVYSMSSTIDPFLAQTYFYDEKAVDNFEKSFKKWLNCLLTPPAEFETNTETKVDVGKVWIETRNKEVPAAPTREQVSIKYHNTHRLDSLRKSAKVLLTNPNMIEIFGKLGSQIDRKVISVRGDKNLHLDVGLQKMIMELLLCYNPLWLRIGLEALYDTIIPLSSNSDVYGLTTFIIQRMFKDPYLKTKHSHPTTPNMLMPAYTDYMKKFTLKKYFMLVYFLDQAKEKKLIPHDPCLFCRNAQYKESREMLIRFTREMIAGIGDITRHLRPLGYIVSHKQSFLDEFKFAVHNLATDLKDGVRLTKAMEIILVKNNLTRSLRTPPISRMQKIHNVELALNALRESDFKIVGNIESRDIVDGHREKTLSLLWQIIHVFRAPLFEKAAIRIQAWWKKKYLIVWAQRRVEEKRLRRKHNAAHAIQIWWRKILYQRLVVKKMNELVAATLIIQKYWRMWMYRSIYSNYKSAAVILQRWYRSRVQIHDAKTVLKKLQLRRDSVMKIQSWYRRNLTITTILKIRDLYINYCKDMQRKLKAVNIIKVSLRSYIIRKKFVNVVQSALQNERARVLKMNIMATKIQTYYRKWRSQTRYLSLKKCAMNLQRLARGMLARHRMKRLQWAIIYVQTIYRGKLLMKMKMIEFQKMKKSAIIIQSYYKMYVAQKYYRRLKNAISCVEQRYLAKRHMQKQRDKYVTLKTNVIIIQSHIRRYLSQKRYRSLLTYAIVIQRQFRANCLTKILRRQYLEKRRTVVCMQSYVRRNIAKKNFDTLKNATIMLQTRYRAQLECRKRRSEYLKLLEVIRYIQAKFRANRLMKVQCESFQKLRAACIYIQRLYRANFAMRAQRTQYERLCKACLYIQTRFRANRLSKLFKNQYRKLQNNTIHIQRKYRAKLLTRQCVTEYRTLKKASIVIQCRYRALVQMRKDRSEYSMLRTSAICLQARYRALLAMRVVRKKYLVKRNACILIQRNYRAYKCRLLQKKEREHAEFLRREAACLKIQAWYRATQKMHVQRNSYRTIRNAIICLQIKYKATMKMQKERASYVLLLRSVRVIQTRYRSQKEMVKCCCEFTQIKQNIITIQRWHRAVKQGIMERNEYITLRKSAIVLQRRYRAKVLMSNARSVFVQQRSAAIKIQQWHRSIKLMLVHRKQYNTLRLATITIQSSYRMYIEQKSYRKLKSATISVQRLYRLHKEGERHRQRYLKFKIAAIKIQQWYRSIKLMLVHRQQYNTLKLATITIQSLYRMYIEQKTYRKLKSATISVQRLYRLHKEGERDRQRYLKMKMATIKIQASVRAFLQRKLYLKIQTERRFLAVVCIQTNWRAFLARRNFCRTIKSVVLIQTKRRAQLLARLHRQDYVEKKALITKLQSAVRAFLARKRFQQIKEDLQRKQEERMRNGAALKIQSIWRGHQVRKREEKWTAVVKLRRRWQRGALQSTQNTLAQRSEDALQVLCHFSDIASVIRAFISLELLTSVFPMIYEVDRRAVGISAKLIMYMSVTNRSISSLETLRLGASILVNMVRYKPTALLIYDEAEVSPILKLMMRWCDKDGHLFRVLCTYLWLFGKYPTILQELKTVLRTGDNNKMLTRIRAAVMRKKRMDDNSCKNKQQQYLHNNSMNSSLLNQSHSRHNASLAARPQPQPAALLPLIEPDFGLMRDDTPRFFETEIQAIDEIFTKFSLPRNG